MFIYSRPNVGYVHNSVHIVVGILPTFCDLRIEYWFYFKYILRLGIGY